MAITNDERREVAARLRKLESDSVGSYSEFCEKLDEAIGLGERQWTCDRLADLIEPEQKKFRIPDGYLIIPDQTKNPYDPHFQVDQFASVNDCINAIANAVMRAEQNAIVMESLERAGFAKRETCKNIICPECGAKVVEQ